MDLELAEVRERIEQLALRVQQNTKTHWVYEWPLRRKGEVASQEIVGQKTTKAVEEVAEVCEKPQGHRGDGSCL
jgi:hypothetical protein